jgi:hypothetical protein
MKKFSLNLGFCKLHLEINSNAKGFKFLVSTSRREKINLQILTHLSRDKGLLCRTGISSLQPGVMGSNTWM